MSNLDALVAAYVAARTGELTKATRTAFRGRLQRFAVGVGGHRTPDDIGRADIERHLRRDDDHKPRTRKAELSTIRGFWAWLLVEGHATKDPTVGVPRVRTPRRLPRAVSGDAVARLLSHAPDERGRLICLLMVQEGLRCLEVAGLDVTDVDHAARTVFVRGKGFHERILPVSDETWAALRSYLAVTGHTAGPLIRSKVRPDRGVSAQHVSDLVSDWFDAAGVPMGTAHKLRHTCASAMAEGGANLLDIRTALGHSSVATTEQYLPLVVDGLRQAMGGRRYGTDSPVPGGDRSAAVVAELAGLFLAGTLDNHSETLPEWWSWEDRSAVEAYLASPSGRRAASAAAGYPEPSLFRTEMFDAAMLQVWAWVKTPGAAK